MRMPGPVEAVGLVLVALGALTPAGCSPAADATPARAETARGPAATKVATVKPERATVRRTTAQPGQIGAYQVTSMQAKVSGYVRSLAVDIGDRVKKGQIL